MMSADSEDTVAAVHRALWSGVEGAKLAPAEAVRSEPPADGEAALDQHIRTLIAKTEPLAGRERVADLTREVRARIDGLGPLDRFAIDADVSEIMVNGDGAVWVERAGRLEHTGHRLDPIEGEHLVRRLAARVGRRVDQTRPSVDVRLADGSRLHAILPPLAVDGPCITIRRFTRRELDLESLAEPAACELLRDAVARFLTIIVAGGTSSGKTTVLNALGRGIDPDARIVTIEDAAELRLPGRHIVRLETRLATEGTPATGLRELVRHALRMRPDRIICGEMRGAEALDLVQAMNTGHRGSLSTVHANSAPDALRRIETMMLLGEADLPLPAVREQIASCVDLVVMTSRRPDGSRGVDSIAAVPPRPTDGWKLDWLFHADDGSLTRSPAQNPGSRR